MVMSMEPAFTSYSCLFRNSLRLSASNTFIVRERTIPTERPPLAGKVSANFVGTACHVISLTDPYSSVLDFLDRNWYFFFQVAPQLYSRGWVDPVSDQLLLRKSGSVGNRTRISGSVARNSDRQTTEDLLQILCFIIIKCTIVAATNYIPAKKTLGKGFK
jgi:hypothetical protein